VKIAQEIRPCRALIFHISVKSEYKFQFWGSYTLVVAPMGVKFGPTELGTVIEDLKHVLAPPKRLGFDA